MEERLAVHQKEVKSVGDKFNPGSVMLGDKLNVNEFLQNYSTDSS
jgi:hypothetical protein